MEEDPDFQDELASYFPAQKSELRFFLMEPGHLRPARRCSHRRIMNYRYGDVARSMEELPELLGRLEQLRFVEWDTHGASLVVFWGVSRAVSTRPILMRLSAMTPRPTQRCMPASPL